MIETILPATAVTVTTRDDLEEAPLFPEEEAALGRAVEKRRREFTTARACARRAFAQLGLPETAIPTGENGEPVWPAGVVGSLTHCAGYRACAVAHATDLLTIGIDSEPNAPLLEGVLRDIARPEELTKLRSLATRDHATHWDRLLFSAKESVYKAWFPLARCWLGFEDATLEIDRDARTFAARLLVPGPVVNGDRLTQFSGRWTVQDGIVATAIAVPATEPVA